MKKVICNLLFLFFILNNIFAQKWHKRSLDSTVSFRGISVPNNKTVWVSGSKGSIYKTSNFGKNWQKTAPIGSEKLDFRDIEAFGNKIAYAISSGEASQGFAKIYKTSDSGKNWTEQFSSNEAGVFLDGIDFWDEQNGVVFGDPILDKFYLLLTNNGGKTWERLNPDLLPKTLKNEAAFAASGTSIRVSGTADIWIGTGGHIGTSRLFHSTNRGQTWQIIETPFRSEASSGIFGINIGKHNEILLSGGNYQKTNQEQIQNYISFDQGKTWKASKIVPKQGLKEASVFLQNSWLAVGPAGSCLTFDNGNSWSFTDTNSFHCIDSYKKTTWAAGGKGLIGKFEIK